MNKSDFENRGGFCQCRNVYSIEPHGTEHALMFASCPHRHGYNLANISAPDLPMLQTMVDRLNRYTDAQAELAEKDAIQDRLDKSSQEEFVSLIGQRDDLRHQLAEKDKALSLEHDQGESFLCQIQDANKTIQELRNDLDRKDNECALKIEQNVASRERTIAEMQAHLASHLGDQQFQLCGSIGLTNKQIEDLRAEDEVTLGVGDGSGQMFVRGKYDAIKLLQGKLLELAEAKLKTQEGE